MRRGRLRALSAALLALAGVATSLAITTAPAYATHARTANSGTLNTATWRICVSGWVEGQNASFYAISNINPTDVNASNVICTGSWNVSSQAASYPDSWYGNTYCFGTLSGGWCTGKAVQLNGRTVTTTTQWNKTAAHEFGHVAGLGHRSTNASCMTSGAAPPIVTVYDQHDKDAINSTY